MILILILFFLTIPALASENYRVVRVIDGDTIELSTGEKVRYIGVDTPEMKDPLGPEIAEYNRSLVKDQTIRLEYGKERHDRYGRTLAYVYVDDTFINALLLEQGMAKVMTIRPNTKHKEYFEQLEQEAKTARRGIWSK